MTINYHQHFTGLELSIVIAAELLWLVFLYVVVRRVVRRRRSRARQLPDLPYQTPAYKAMMKDAETGRS